MRSSKRSRCPTASSPPDESKPMMLTISPTHSTWSAITPCTTTQSMQNAWTIGMSDNNTDANDDKYSSFNVALSN